MRILKRKRRAFQNANRSMPFACASGLLQATCVSIQGFHPDKLYSIKLCRQYLDRMYRVDPGQAVNLAATGEAGGDEAGLRVGGRGGKQHPVGQGDADVVVAVLIAERAGHAAAAGIELVDLQAGNTLQGGQRTGGPECGLLLAVAVQQDAPVQRPEPQVGCPGGVGHEGIDERALPGDFSGGRTEPEIPVLIDQRRQAAWLAADDRDALTGQKLLEILPAQLAAELQEPL